ncbi:MAG: AAA family ATPase [Bacteroidales bacterium]|nr:AAA family ATPase [Bacteroidales bacterium]
MKLLKLNIRNIASISEAEIDFTKDIFATESIFLIYGETGSGKTTILDAICIALYGRTPRLDNSRTQKTVPTYTLGDGIVNIMDTKQLLKADASEGEVSLFFTAANDKNYTAQWKVSRVRGSTGIKDPEWTLIDDGRSILIKPNARNEAERHNLDDLTGLSYDQFCKTAMLAQGEFTHFLKSNDEEKCEILEKITGNTAYRIVGSEINILKNKADYDVKLDKDVLGRTVICGLKYNPEENSFEDYTNVVSNEISKIEKEAKDFEEKAVVATELIGAKEALESIREADEEYEGQLSTEAACVKTAAALVILQGERLKELEAHKASHRRMQAKIDSLSADVSMYENWNLIENSLQKVPVLEQKISQNKEQMKTAKSQLTAIEAEKKAKEEVREAIRKKIVGLEEEYTQKEKELAKLEPEKRKAHKRQLEDLRVKLGEVERVVSILAEKEKALKSRQEELLGKKSELEKKKNSVTDLLEKYNTSVTKEGAAKELYDKTATALEQFVRLNENGAALRALVKADDNCPVCGREVTQEILDSFDDNAINASLQHLEKSRDNAKAAWNDSLKSLNDAKTAYGTEYRLLDADKKTLQKLENELQSESEAISHFKETNHRILTDCQFDWDMGDLSAHISKRKAETLAELEKASKTLEIIETIEKEIAGMHKRIDEVRKNEESPTELSVKAVEQKLNEAKTRIAALESALTGLEKERDNYIETAGKYITIANWKEKWNSNREEFLTQLSEKTADYNKLKKDSQDLKLKVDSLGDELDKIKLKREEYFKTYPDIQKRTDEFDAAEFSSDDLRRVAAEPILSRWVTVISRTETAREQMKRIQKKKEEAQGRFDSFKKKYPRIENPEFYLKGEPQLTLRTPKEYLETLKNKWLESKGKLTQSAISERKALEKAEILEREIGNKIKLAARWKSLDAVLGGPEGKRFRDAAMRMLFREILGRANESLRHIAPHYQLHNEPGSMVILVRDLEQGGYTRATSTLSGGESFVVSLALALGLSTFGKEGLAVDTIFIDEGFGTLSEDILERVIITLEDLKRYGCRVGLISHVPALRNRISAKLEVRDGRVRKVV